MYWRMYVDIGCVVFFFQAEDGIRDLVRSRGLGDVYKRQSYLNVLKLQEETLGKLIRKKVTAIAFEKIRDNNAVSYTHLTLPTSDLV